MFGDYFYVDNNVILEDELVEFGDIVDVGVGVVDLDIDGVVVVVGIEDIVNVGVGVVVDGGV